MFGWWHKRKERETRMAEAEVQLAEAVRKLDEATASQRELNGRPSEAAIGRATDGAIEVLERKLEHDK